MSNLRVAALVLTVLFLSALVSSQPGTFGECALDSHEQTIRTFDFCTAYSGQQSCCPQEVEDRIASELSQRAFPIFGDDVCCWDNVKSLHCGWNCEPGNKAFVRYANNSNIFEYNITVSKEMAERMYTACENVQFPGSPEYIGDIYPNPVALVEGLSSEGDPNYTPSANNPKATFFVVDSPSAMNAPACAKQIPTPPADSSEAGRSAAGAILSGVSFLLGSLFALW